MSQSSRSILRSRALLRALWPAFVVALLLVVSLTPRVAHSQTPVWTPIDYADDLDTDNATSRILWKNANGQYALWGLNNSATLTAGMLITPDAGYTCKKIAYHSFSGVTILLWDNPTAHKIALWTISSNLQTISKKTVFSYPTTQYTPGSIALDYDHSFGSPVQIELCWVMPGDKFLFWRVNSGSGNVDATSDVYGPYPNLKPGPMADNVNVLNLVLTNATTGQITILVIPEYTAPTHTYTFGPYSGTSLLGIASGADNNMHLLWGYTSGKIALWSVGVTTGTINKSAIYGPITGVSPLGIGYDAGGYTYVLWKYNTDSKVALWKISQQLSSIVAGYTLTAH